MSDAIYIMDKISSDLSDFRWHLVMSSLGSLIIVNELQLNSFSAPRIEKGIMMIYNN